MCGCALCSIAYRSSSSSICRQRERVNFEMDLQRSKNCQLHHSVQPNHRNDPAKSVRRLRRSDAFVKWSILRALPRSRVVYFIWTRDYRASPHQHKPALAQSRHPLGKLSTRARAHKPPAIRSPVKPLCSRVLAPQLAPTHQARLSLRCGRTSWRKRSS